ncbi:MAG: LuxR C-terminal-related transcriptional regulator [Alphaproteobacteria bacterium]|nr:LuxR C-terminal-related transcriptional regulator [Alphaproteobacteria bacterium]
MPFKRSLVHTEDSYSLTRQQKRVLRLLSEGNSNKVIAARLKITEATVKAHMSEIFRTMNCQNRTQAALMGLCLRFGLPVNIIIGDSEPTTGKSLPEH